MAGPHRLGLAVPVDQQTDAAGREATRHQNDLRLALKEVQLHRLPGHISPHFPFNTLNNADACGAGCVAPAEQAMLSAVANTIIATDFISCSSRMRLTLGGQPCRAQRCMTCGRGGN
ncbi:hypothetical protein [Xanthomonas vasicola]|uniref:hypothetical protein n=1 Tax=Xanthomonas vasicola TaxID=56459 RepID=UPI0005318871|nr:hypothetical protein [Xanthomonas vasicola]KGR37681.1 hypothetical protein NX05_21310 [Xanthomonas vasicola]KGR42711.1 hypothetical protein NX04_10530 [Xanthomonas vasicola]KGR60424.1 hypothetical protein NX79_10790 [Xanthomonas vasicola]MDO6983754.1 hypothetical protein [Xanthomonas vasicola]PPV03409.1 hypothetical protein XvhCFBP2543_06120 [Xanthomonas vasicola]